MQKLLILLGVMLYTQPWMALSQHASFGLNYRFFLDNAEFEGSTLMPSQTLSGGQLSPYITFQIDRQSRLQTGVDILYNLGEVGKIRRIEPNIHFWYQSKQWSLWAGKFPRSQTLAEYSDLLFTDSIQYFRPNVHGVLLRWGENHQFLKFWLDWTGMQTSQVRESFLAGMSFQYPILHNVYIAGQTYLFHLANVRPRRSDFVVCDNAQAEISLYWNPFPSSKSFQTMLSTGFLAAYERERQTNQFAHIPLSALLRANVVSKRFTFENVLVMGQPRLLYYATYGSNLYWASPLLQQRNYFRSTLKGYLIKNKNWDASVGLKIHVSERQVFFQQLITLKAVLNRKLRL